MTSYKNNSKIKHVKRKIKFRGENMTQTLTATNINNARYINFQGERFEVPAEMTAGQVLQAMSINLDGYTMQVEGETVYVMPATGTKGSDEGADEDSASEDLEDEVVDYSDEVLEAIPNTESVMTQALRSVCNPAPSAPRQEVRLINGQLVPFTRRSNEDIYDKLVAIEEKLDALLAK